VIGRHASL